MCSLLSLFFFNDTATTEIYTLSLHDALPICESVKNDKPTISMSLSHCIHQTLNSKASTRFHSGGFAIQRLMRSEERFSRNAETDLVCRLLLEKKNHTYNDNKSLSQITKKDHVERVRAL